MTANYHTHTPRCRHASGTEREYAENARKGGLRILGFSDHTPYDYSPSAYKSGIRMEVEELGDYVSTLEGLRREYEGQLDIRIGLEVEYYPKLFRRLLDTAKAHGVEYMILGQHFVGNEEGEPYSGQPTDDEGILDRYVKQSIEGLQTGAITYVAHPDLMRYVGDGRIYDRHMRELCRAARDLSIPLEINLLGVRDHRHYPNEAFWRIAGEEGNTAILGSDAHQPEAVVCPEAEAAGRALAERYGLPVLETMPLRDIRTLG